MSGKPYDLGGSLIRPEAAGFGTMYFASNVLARFSDSLNGKRLAVSGFGNVAWGAVSKASQRSGVPERRR